jgi:2-haloacid dehalogenase
MKYRWILFDADGTLFDYDRAEAKALSLTFAQFGWRFDAGHAATYRHINAQIWREFEQGRITQAKLRARRFELLFEAVGLQSDPQVFSARYLHNLSQGVDLIDGAQEIVQALYGRVGLLIITNGLQDVQRPRFARSAIGHYFDDLVISEEVGAAKPDRRIFDVAFQKIGHPDKEKVLIVGDSLTSDIKGGGDYGIDTCWFNPGRQPRPSDLAIRYEIGDLRELSGLDGMAQGQAM